MAKLYPPQAIITSKICQKLNLYTWRHYFHWGITYINVPTPEVKKPVWWLRINEQVRVQRKGGVDDGRWPP